MYHRFTTWWRALSVVLLSLATVTWPSAAQAGPTSTFVVVHQDAVAALSSQGTDRFSTTLRLANASRAHVSVTLYPALITQGALEAIVDGDGASTKPMSTTGFDLNCERSDEATFSVTLHTHGLASPPRTCDGATPALRLICTGLVRGRVSPSLPRQRQGQHHRKVVPARRSNIQRRSAPRRVSRRDSLPQSSRPRQDARSPS